MCLQSLQSRKKNAKRLAEEEQRKERRAAWEREVQYRKETKRRKTAQYMEQRALKLQTKQGLSRAWFKICNPSRR
jgi:hypothetical protein